MIKGSYEYLKPYQEGPVKGCFNWFGRVNSREIEKSQNIIKISFPDQLEDFYREIGYGFLQRPHHALNDEKYDFCNTNRIFPPLVAAHFYRGIFEHQTEPKEEALEYEDHWLAQWTLDMFEPGDLPFFEIGDSSNFMTMKLHSNNPNAVWYMGAEKVEESFETFIWRLYYEDPTYYAKSW